MPLSRILILKMNEHAQSELAKMCSDLASWPVMICLLGNFRLLRAGQPVPIRAGGKSEVLLAYLALQSGRRVPRERLVQELWPDSDFSLGLNSLNNLVYHLHKLLGPALQGAAPVLHQEGYYRLNVAAGIGLDVVCFDALVESGNRQRRAGDPAAAQASYRHAAELYRADLSVSAGPQSIVERERRRSRYLRLLAHVADYYYQANDYTACLEQAVKAWFRQQVQAEDSTEL
jgi:DNA-binding SARP family transcriptional activator